MILKTNCVIGDVVELKTDQFNTGEIGKVYPMLGRISAVENDRTIVKVENILGLDFMEVGEIHITPNRHLRRTADQVKPANPAHPFFKQYLEELETIS